MARQFRVLQQTFELGVRRDTPRVSAPPGSLYTCMNWLPNLSGFPLRSRGGWTDLSGANFGNPGTNVQRMIHAPFSAGSQLLSVSSDSRLYQINETTGAATQVGTLFDGLGAGELAFFNDLVISPSADGSVRAYKYDGSTVTELSAGSYPHAKYFAPYKARLLAANVTGNRNRWYLSNANDATGWDLTNNYYDTQAEILAVATLRTAALLFHADTTTRVRGTTPGAAGDVEQDNNYFQVGIAGYLGALSICYWRDFVIWADALGIYMSDGAAFVDLVERGGIRALWSGYNFSSANSTHVTCGVLLDYLFVTVWQDSVGERATYVCYLPTRSWYQATNFQFYCYAEQSHRLGTSLYAGRGDVQRIAKLDSVLTAVAGDGNGIGVQPTLETNFYRGNPGKLWMDRLWVGYSLRGGIASTRLDVTATVITGSNILDTTLGSLPRTSVSGTVGEGYQRARLPVPRRGEGMALKLVEAGGYASEIGLYSLESEYDPMARYR